MKKLNLRLGLSLLSIPFVFCSAQDLANQTTKCATVLDPTELHAHIKFLASDEMKGRRMGSEEYFKAARYAADHFEKAGLQSFFPDTTPESRYFQEVPPRTRRNGTPATPSHISAPNVIGYVLGTDNVKQRECVVLGAHLDHVGIQEGEIYNGADDNASGSSAVIEIAELVAKSPLKRTVIFVLFSGEEMGLLGSRHFMQNCPVNIHSIIGMVNLDMIGRTIKEFKKEKTHFIAGIDSLGDQMMEFVEMVNAETLNWPLMRLTPDYGHESASDHRSFHDKGIPAVFFFSGEHSDLHEPTDDVERIDLDKITCITTLVYEVVKRLANEGFAIDQEKFPVMQLTFEPAQQGFPSWSPDGKTLVYAHTDQYDTLNLNGLWKISMDDMKREQFYAVIAEHPMWSPDNKYIVFDAEYGNSIKMIPENGGEIIDFLPPGLKIEHGGLPRWSPDGSKLLFTEGGTLVVWIYDVESKELTKIYQDQDELSLPGCWSKDGKSVLLSVRDQETRQSTIWKVSVDGKIKEPITGHRENFYRYLELSPDGSMLAYVTFNLEARTSTIWVMPATGGKSVKLVTSLGFNESPRWSPDGTKLAFTSTRSGYFDVWMMDLDMDQLKKELGI